MFLSTFFFHSVVWRIHLSLGGIIRDYTSRKDSASISSINRNPYKAELILYEVTPDACDPDLDVANSKTAKLNPNEASTSGRPTSVPELPPSVC